jgi:flagellar biosynthetic protein FliO
MSSAGASILMLLRVVLSLALVLGLCWGAVWALKRRGTGRPLLGSTDRLEIVERRALSRTASLALVRVSGREYLVGVTEQRVELLDRTGPGIDTTDLTAIETTGTVDLTALTTPTADPSSADAQDGPRSLVSGTRRTGFPTTSADADSSARMGFVEALRELTVRRS